MDAHGGGRQGGGKQETQADGKHGGVEQLMEHPKWHPQGNCKRLKRKIKIR